MASILIVGIIVIAGLITGSTYSGSEGKYKTYVFDSYFTNYECSFEYPACFYEPKYEGFFEVYFDSLSLYKDRKAWFHAKEDSMLKIDVLSGYHSLAGYLDLQLLKETTADEKASRCFDFASGRSLIDNPNIKILSSADTVVDGNKARFLAFSIIGPEWNNDHLGTVKYVYIEHDNIIFLVSLFRYERENLEPDPTFDHLIETFKISP